jgi:hypothetical protein
MSNYKPQRNQKLNKRIEQALHITKSVKNQFAVTLLLLIASIATYILGAYGTLGLFNDFSQNIHDFLLGLSGNLIVAIIIFFFLEQGIKSLHPIGEIRTLPAKDFIESMKKVKHGGRIRILETFTYLITEQQYDFFDAIRDAARNGAKIEILLFHPYSEGARKRAQQLRGKIDVEDETRKNLARFNELYDSLDSRYKKNLEIKLYTALPSIAMYRCNDWAYVSLFPIGNRADRCPNLKVPMDNPFGSYVDDMFDELWIGTPGTPTISLHSHMFLYMEDNTLTNSISHPGYYFAYDVMNGEVDRTQCFLVENSNTFLFSIYENVKEKDRTIFFLDRKTWQAVPHRLNPDDVDDVDEFNRACNTIVQRYEWPAHKLGRHSIIIRLKDIQEISK